MSQRLRGSLQIWRSRKTRTVVETANVAYLALLVFVTALVPLARMIWIESRSDAFASIFSSPTSPGIYLLVVSGFWSTMLLIGRLRGPALMPSFLLYSLGESPLPRPLVFFAPILRAISLFLVSGAGIAVVIVQGLQAHGLASSEESALFVLSGALSGVVAAVCWLIGQSMPRIALIGGISLAFWTLLGCTTLSFGLSNLLSLMPSAYPGQSHPLMASVGLFALSAFLVSFIPSLLKGLELTQLLAQASRWELATAHTLTMNLTDAASTYQTKPYWGRRLIAVNLNYGLPLLFFVRGMIGATRTPGRLGLGLIALSASGVLAAAATNPLWPGLLLGAGAGIVAFLGAGTLTDGVGHAVRVAGDHPYYGLSDAWLVAYHLLFPFALICSVPLLSSMLAAATIPVSIGLSAASSLTVGLLVLAIRVNTALKGSMPPALLTPAPTPVGDLSIFVQLLWALDGVLLAALAGLAAPGMLRAPMFIILTAAIVISLSALRWRNR